MQTGGSMFKHSSYSSAPKPITSESPCADQTSHDLYNDDHALCHHFQIVPIRIVPVNALARRQSGCITLAPLLFTDPGKLPQVWEVFLTCLSLRTARC